MQKKVTQLRRIAILVSSAAILALSLGISHQKEEPRQVLQQSRRVLYFVDPMHPSYRSDKPGIAPDCGMQLEPVYEQAKGDSGEDRIHVASSMIKSAGINFATAEERSVTRHLHVIGRVRPIDSKIFTVNAGVDGFIRETYSDSVGAFVVKNQKLGSYYAPEFIAAASGFLAANERVPGSVSNEGARSIQNYADRLRNLGMSDVQIHRVAELRQLPESIDIVSPTNGVVLSRNVSAGQHFGRETQFYQIADLSQVWVVADVEQEDQANVRAGTTAQISSPEDERRVAARITQSLPQSDPSSGLVKLRLEMDNSAHRFLPDMFVDVDLPVQYPAAITVPQEALVDSGTATRVYIWHDGGEMESRLVTTGWRTADLVEIRKGLQAGEKVVASGAFLIDSESRLRSPLHQSSIPQSAAVKAR